MAYDNAVDQFVFDYYVKKCVDSHSNSDFLQREDIKMILQAMLQKSIDPDYPGNKLKAHLVIIMHSLRELVDKGLEEWTHEASVHEDGDGISLLTLLDDLQSSITYFQTLGAPEITELSRKCSLHIFVLMMRIIHQDWTGTDSKITKHQEGWREKILNKLIANIKSKTKSEKKIYDQCEKLGAEKSEDDQLPTFNQLKPQVSKFLCEVSQLIELPSPLKLAKIFSLEQSLRGEQVDLSPSKRNSCSSDMEKSKADLLSDTRLSTMDDLKQIMGSDLEEDEDDTEIRVSCLKEKSRKFRELCMTNETEQQQEKRKLSSTSPARRKRQKTSSEPSDSSSPAKRRTPKKMSTPRKSIYHFPESDEELEETSQDPPRNDLPSVSSSTPRLSLGNKKKKIYKPVVARWSLINFPKSRKPPSHQRAMSGKWTPGEEEEFIAMTVKIGEGNWLEIKDALKSLRSTVQLKDKWRNFSRSRVMQVAKQQGREYRPNVKKMRH